MGINPLCPTCYGIHRYMLNTAPETSFRPTSYRWAGLIQFGVFWNRSCWVTMAAICAMIFHGSFHRWTRNVGSSLFSVTMSSKARSFMLLWTSVSCGRGLLLHPCLRHLKAGEMAGGGLGLRKTTGPFFWNVSLTHSIYTGPLPSEGLVTLFQVGAKM